jgi:hypothetical protein
MKAMIYPHDQSQVVFTDKTGKKREGKYVLGLKGFVELSDGEEPEDCSNLIPESEIISWEYAPDDHQDDNLIEVL